MRVLVVYGSKRGGTAGLANMVRAALRSKGFDVAATCPAAWIRSLDDFDVVVVGGALYNNRWHRHAARFVTRHRAALQQRHVWFFSSGPLNDSARTGGIAPVPQVARLMGLVSAHGHMTFGGCELEDGPAAVGRAARWAGTGDWRDPVQVTAWAASIADELGVAPSGAAPTSSGSPDPVTVAPVTMAPPHVPDPEGVPENHLEGVGG